ncbi:host specificity factor TipJ family phage tail protein [Franconibacter pulveris 601]|uniref:host specificity factor TipJ family phage tail protein n=1 Tax=Franconibacter pulveris TaxID=435910 RepID=UPI000467736D|nr:host specificity factor TipJ family phage tail protein [Franconibacter pulveris]
MTIRIFPSRLPGEPLETHKNGAITLHQWLMENVACYAQNRPQHPIAVEVNGTPVPPKSWPQCQLHADSDVRIYPVPYGPAVPAWVAWSAVAVAVASAAYSIYMMSTMDKGGFSAAGQGDQISLDPAKANTARLGDPIREVFGLYRIYPDYVVQPVSRFSNERDMITTMFLCVGVGEFDDISMDDIRIGATPVLSFGEDVTYTIYQPGADVSADPRSENWYNSTEVGNTGSGTAGLDLGSSGPETASITADAVLVSGGTVTLIGSSPDNDDDSETEIPLGWVTGTLIDIEAPDTYTVTTIEGYSVISGSVSEIAPVAGMPVTLGINNDQFDLVVDSYQPAIAPVPGVGGSTASVTASAAPQTYNFSTSPQTFSFTWKGRTWPVSLTANYVNMSGLVAAITSQLTGSGLVANDRSGRIIISEESSPFAGGVITYSTLPVAVFGSAPSSVTGVASTGGAAGRMANIRLSYASGGGKFAGLPDGQQRFSLSPANYQYQITAIDGLTITVARVAVSGNNITSVDATWPGFVSRTLLDASVTGVNDKYDWIGPFLSCPDGETTDRLEINLNFQNGLVKYNDKGKKRNKTVVVVVQYRPAGSQEDWQEKAFSYTRKTEDQIGFTEVLDVARGQYEVRMRRTEPPAGSSTRDQVYWQALRARLSSRPIRYDDVTTIALTIRTGSRLAAQSDRRISITAKRRYEHFPSRSISGAIWHVLTSIGMREDQIDGDGIAAIESAWWTPRGETFDYSASESGSSALDILKKICNAGMGYFLLSDGLASVGREGIKAWSGVVSPQETTDTMQTAFTAPTEDDFDAVDVTFISSVTWAEETVQCRFGSDTPRKIEDYKLDGVIDADRAWRIGMRRLMKYIYQHLSHSAATELDALCYQFGDRLVLTDDIPGSETISCLITDMSRDGETVTLKVSEPLDWTFENPRCVLRFQDGSASVLLIPQRVDEFTLTIPESSALRLDEWDMDSPYIEPLRLVFCSSKRVGYDAIISSIDPSSDGTCQLTAAQYSPLFYQFDDANYPGAAV